MVRADDLDAWVERSRARQGLAARVSNLPAIVGLAELIRVARATNQARRAGRPETSTAQPVDGGDPIPTDATP